MFNIEKSIYSQIADMIEIDILTGILKVNDRVPSTNELANLYQINPATARKGMNILVDEDIIYKKRGLGMFVSVGAKEKIQKKRKEEFFSKKLPVALEEIKLLNIEKDEIISKILEVWND